MDSVTKLVSIYNSHKSVERFDSWWSDWYLEIPNIDRNDLASMFAALGFSRGIEVGTRRGAYAEVLCEANPSLSLVCVDAWTTYPGYQILDSRGSKIEATERLSKYNVELHQAFSPDAAQEFDDKEFDFVYLDSNHSFAAVAADLTAWLPKIRTGGIMAGHDWHCDIDPQALFHVVQAVHGFTWVHNIAPVYVLGDEDEKLGEKRDEFRSWFWIVE